LKFVREGEPNIHITAARIEHERVDGRVDPFEGDMPPG